MNLVGTHSMETERLMLRKIRYEDAEVAFANWCGIPSTSRYLSWEPHKDVEETKALFTKWSAHYDSEKTQGHYYHWIVVEKVSEEPMGTIGVDIKEFDSVGVVGYCYGERWWNKGYGTEVLRAVIDYMFDEVGIEAVTSYHSSNNPASGRVMEKSGMRQYGRLRNGMFDKPTGGRADRVEYAICWDEWVKKG